MPAIVVSTTDQVENVKSALGTKGNVTVNDDAGNELAQIEGKPAINKEGEEKDTEKDKDSSAALEGDEQPDDKNTEDSANSGEEEKSGNKAKRKIDKLVKENSELKEALAAKSQPPISDDKGKPNDKAAPAKEEEEPKSDDYDTQADFMKALSKWAAKQARKEQKVEDEKARAVDAQNQVVANWKKQIDTAKTKYADWDEVMDDTVIGNTAARMLVETADGAELAYYIAKHPDEAKQFAEMTSEREVAMALGMIRASLKASIKSDDKAKPNQQNDKLKVSTKPKPITPVAGSTSVSSTKAPKDMSYQEYKRYRQQQETQRRSA